MIELNDMERTILKPGDVLVLRPCEKVTEERMSYLADAATHFTEATGIRVMVVENGIDVLVAAEADPA